MTPCYYCARHRDCTGSPPMCSDCRKANPEREAATCVPDVFGACRETGSLHRGVSQDLDATASCRGCGKPKARLIHHSTVPTWAEKMAHAPTGEPGMFSIAANPCSCGIVHTCRTNEEQRAAGLTISPNRFFVADCQGGKATLTEAPPPPDHSQPEAKGGQEIDTFKPCHCGCGGLYHDACCWGVHVCPIVAGTGTHYLDPV